MLSAVLLSIVHTQELCWSCLPLLKSARAGTCEVGGKDGHLGSPAKQLLGHGLCGARSGQHGPALGIQKVHAARAPASPESLRMLQQLCAATPVHHTDVLIGIVAGEPCPPDA